MNPFLLTANERLADWKALRKSLAGMDEQQQLATVAKYWAQAPLLTIAYDLEKPETWPTPWEMIHANQWCRSSVAIGMEATLRLAGFVPERLKLCLIIDRDIQEMLMILVVDDDWVLNYDWGVVQKYPSSKHSILRQWRFTGRVYAAV